MSNRVRSASVCMAILVAAAASAIDFPQGVVFYLSLDEIRAGGVAPDMSGSNRNARAESAKWSAGRLNAAVELGAKNSYLALTNQPVLNPKRLTVSAWFKTDKSAVADRYLFDKRADSGYALRILGGPAESARRGKLCFTVSGHDCVSDKAVTDGAWHHGAATFDGEALKLYVDGQVQAQVTAWKGEPASNAHDLTLGMNRSNPTAKEKDVALDGALDEVVLFGRALSADEIKSVGNAAKPKFTKSQVARRLAELNELRDRGLILQDFYERKVQECEVVP